MKVSYLEMLTGLGWERHRQVLALRKTAETKYIYWVIYIRGRMGIGPSKCLMAHFIDIDPSVGFDDWAKTRALRKLNDNRN